MGHNGCHVLPDNCRRGATREPVQCHGVTSNSGFPTTQASFLRTASLKRPKKRSSLSLLVGALFKKSGLFLNTPHIYDSG